MVFKLDSQPFFSMDYNGYISHKPDSVVTAIKGDIVSFKESKFKVRIVKGEALIIDIMV